jgi:hypothetical protein
MKHCIQTPAHEFGACTSECTPENCAWAYQAQFVLPPQPAAGAASEYSVVRARARANAADARREAELHALRYRDD